MVGDGEAETGPLATSWHSNKFLNPIRDGAVLPILNLNAGARVVAAPELTRLNLVAEELARAVSDGRKVVMLKWHGSFASGATLHEPVRAARAVDHTAEFCIRVRELERRGPAALRRLSPPNWAVQALASYRRGCQARPSPSLDTFRLTE